MRATVSKEKVLFLHHGHFWNRGSEMVLLALLGNLDRNRYEPLLVCNHRLLAAEANKLNVKTIVTNWPEVMVETGHNKLQFLGIIKKVFWLRKLINRESINLITCNSGLPNQAGYYAAKLTHIPMLTYIHSPYNKRYIYLYRLHKTTMAIFVSRAIQMAMGRKVPFSNSRIIHNGIDTNRFYPVTIRNASCIHGVNIPTDIPVIGQIGSLIHRKGIDLLIKSADILRQQNIGFHIVLAGSGPDENNYKDMVAKLDLDDHFTFAGDTETPELFYQHIFDINVLASRSEAFGITLAEGAACGLPCVGSNVEGIPEVIAENSTGLLFEPGNASDLADKLRTLLIDSKLRKTFGDSGRQFVVENLSQNRQVKQFHDALSDLHKTKTRKLQ